jgi:transcriptional regulator with XRE-family HTH domain
MAEIVTTNEPISDPEPLEFGPLLRKFREDARRSGNALAREVEVDPSYLSRIEHGEREPPRPAVIMAMGRALGLSLFDLNRLLLAAGYAPTSVLQLGRWDPALQDVVDVLTDPRLTPAEREEFRSVVRLIATHWGRGRMHEVGSERGFLMPLSPADASLSDFHAE